MNGMRIERPDTTAAKGWYLGPWNSSLPAAVGYAHEAIDEPHLHLRATEIYLIAHGEITAVVEQDIVRLTAGDVLVIEPGEAHTFRDSTSDYRHFVLLLPGLAGDEARADKVLVPAERLGM
jgi:mannose-6-phosphate isomerase-like protein (cupin superfamily)